MVKCVKSWLALFTTLHPNRILAAWKEAFINLGIGIRLT